jgi:hypothetical protein
MAEKAKLSSPLTPLFPTPSAQDIAGGKDRMDGIWGTPAPSGGVVKLKVYEEYPISPAVMSTPMVGVPKGVGYPEKGKK